ncbi:MAG: aspartate carbamoyltransferase [Thermoproteales archaeon]|nr:aspartate carbamoyltransferase [Thermoproteales archaeon]
MGSLKNKDIISIRELKNDEILDVINVAKDIKKNMKSYRDILKGYILATAFFEPSTRTKLSFQSAMKRLGGSVIDLPPEEASSRAKGENLADTIRMLECYSDIIVIRHKIEGTAKFVSEIANIPIINGGDGTKEHPTQALIDLFTIYEAYGRLDGLTVGVLGDLKYGRAARSFIFGISKFSPEKIYLISPEQLRARKDVLEFLNEKKIFFREKNDYSGILKDLDVLYVTRIQRERFPDPMEYERVRGSYRITKDILKDVKDNFIILHPLPRVDEIDFSVDGTKFAKYFVQAANGVPIRMALLKMILVE